MKIDVIIAHASFDERRRAPMRRLAEAFGEVKPLILASTIREHANKWAVRLWREVQRSQADAVVCLNDDVIPHPDLLRHAAQLASLLPDDIVSLHCTYPRLKVAADDDHKLARCYWVSGPAYLMRPTQARDLLTWLETVPREWFDGQVNEDGAMASWLWSKQRPAFATIPALVRHDTTIPSTLAGYDQHPMRTSPVDWDDYPITRPWQIGDAEIAPYIPVPWMTDGDLRLLGDSLRAVIPLCAMCLTTPAWIRNSMRNTGVCRTCAGHITHQTMQAMLQQNGVRIPTVVTPAQAEAGGAPTHPLRVLAEAKASR